MTRRDFLRRLASQRREYAADALKCEAEADKAGDGDAAEWRRLADAWWKLVAETATEYQLVKNRRRQVAVLPFRRA